MASLRRCGGLSVMQLEMPATICESWPICRALWWPKRRLNAEWTVAGGSPRWRRSRWGWFFEPATFWIPLTISTTKTVNTCWAPSPIWDINWLPKMKSCLECCSQRSCAASCSGFSLFELSSEKSELHFVVIYVGMLWVMQKNPKACSCGSCWVTATYGMRTPRPFLALDSRSFCSNILLNDKMHFVVIHACTSIL